MSEGFILLHRQLLDWEWYDEPVVRAVFIHFLLRANHADNEWRGTLVKRGSFISTYDKLSKEIGFSVKQIRTAIDKLKKTGEVANDGTRQHTVFIIKNYDLYQPKGKQKAQQPANDGQTSGKQRATNNNDNNENNEINTLFDAFWSVYPNKQAKQKAFESWQKKIKTSELAEQVIRHVTLRKQADDQWLKESGKFIPMPTTFLNQARWEDQYQANQASPTTRKNIHMLPTAGREE